MNKKTGKKREYDDQEDLEIRNAAYFKNSSQVLLLFILIFLFGFTLFNSLCFIGKYNKKQGELANGGETIEINNRDNNIYIVNSGKIDKTITQEDFLTTNELVLTNISTLELENKNTQDESIITYNVKYNIEENDFSNNLYSQNDSVLRVRFSYSYDNEEWYYVDNAISTVTSAITPLVGNYYDVAGVVANIKVLTNKKLASKASEKTKVYWKCETIIKNNGDAIGKTIKADFQINYEN